MYLEAFYGGLGFACGIGIWVICWLAIWKLIMKIASTKPGRSMSELHELILVEMKTQNQLMEEQIRMLDRMASAAEYVRHSR